MEETIPHLLEQINLDDHWWQQHLSSIRESSSKEVNGLGFMAFGISSGQAIHRAGTGQTSPIANFMDACVPNVVLAYIVKECDLVRFRPSVGVVHWQRRVGRCPKGCKGTQVVPLDLTLGIKGHQQTSLELVQLGCLLAVFVPFETVTVIARRFTGIQLNAQTIWSWVQLLGKKAMNQLQEEMAQLALGQEPFPEPLSEALKKI